MNEEYVDLYESIKYESTLVNRTDSRQRCMTGQEAASPTYEGMIPLEKLCLRRLEKSALAFADAQFRDPLTFAGKVYEPWARIAYAKGAQGTTSNAKILVDSINNNARDAYTNAKDIVELSVGLPEVGITTLKLTSGAAFDAAFVDEIVAISNSTSASKPTKTRTEIEAIAARCFKNKGIEAGKCSDAGVQFARIVNADLPVPKQAAALQK